MPFDKIETLFSGGIHRPKRLALPPSLYGSTTLWKRAKRDRWTDGRIVSDDNHIHDRPSVKHDDDDQCHTNVRGRMFDFEPRLALSLHSHSNKRIFSSLISFIHPSERVDRAVHNSGRPARPFPLFLNLNGNLILNDSASTVDV